MALSPSGKERRDFYRMVVDCPVEYKKQGSEQMQVGSVQDLSARGLKFIAAEAMSPGTLLEVTIRPSGEVGLPFVSEIEVLRCDPTRDSNEFAIACIIKRMLVD